MSSLLPKTAQKTSLAESKKLAAERGNCWNVINIQHITMGECVEREQTAVGSVTLRVGQRMCAVGVAEGGSCCVIGVERGGQRRRKLDVGQVRKGTASVVGCWLYWSGQLLVWRREYATESRCGQWIIGAIYSVKREELADVKVKQKIRNLNSGLSP